MIFFPTGVDEAKVRIPVVAAGIALICLALFVPTWIIPKYPDGIDRPQLTKIFNHWKDHPYLEISDEFAVRFLSPALKKETEELREDWFKKHTLPGATTVEEEQAEFNQDLDRVVKGTDTLLRKLALVPERGPRQIGWFTHMFLHFGWWHLLGNMLFLCLVAPLLEDAWGRMLFLTFYLLGGLAAAAAFYFSHLHSPGMMGGASGAIAAAMGAFSVRFAKRRVRIAYAVFLVYRLFYGIKKLPAWLCGLVWFGSEVITYLMHTENGTAVTAHIGGFVFGASLALGMKAVGLEKKFVTYDESGPLVASVHPNVEQARVALSNSDVEGARRHFHAALKADLKDFDAQWGLVLIDLDAGSKRRAIHQLEQSLEGLLRDNQRDRAVCSLLDVWSKIEPSELRPAFSWQMSRAVDASGLASLAVVIALYLRAAEGGSPDLAVKAYTRAAEVQLEVGDRNGVLRSMEAARALPQLTKELSDRLKAVERQLPAERLPVLQAIEPSKVEPEADESPQLELDEISYRRRSKNGTEGVPQEFFNFNNLPENLANEDETEKQAKEDVTPSVIDISKAAQ